MSAPADTLKCRRCGETKPIAEFDKQSRDGPLEAWNVRKRCKSCIHNSYLARRTKPKKLKAMMRASRRWKDRHPGRHAELAREYRERHPEKIIAQNRLNYAIRKGTVVRQPCEACGTTDRVHAHHVSYKPEDWFNVNWLCFVCHKIEHAS